ncbi:MAG: hypothetical protein ACI8ZM_003720 [Crocinitomix sp.]
MTKNSKLKLFANGELRSSKRIETALLREVTGSTIYGCTHEFYLCSKEKQLSGFYQTDSLVLIESYPFVFDQGTTDRNYFY